MLLPREQGSLGARLHARTREEAQDSKQSADGEDARGWQRLLHRERGKHLSTTHIA